MPFTYKHDRPSLTADCVVFAESEGKLQVLLVQRDRDPFAGCWAFPGGFVEPGEELADAARRELMKETGIRLQRVEQVGAFGGVGRDPRGWVVSVAFYGVMDQAEMETQRPRAADDAREAAWFPLGALPPLAFDHDDILRRAVRCFNDERRV